MRHLRDRVSPLAWPRARELRKNATPAERALWQALRRHALGVRFRRQYVVRGWIVDFYCPSKALAVEVDGPYHVTRVATDLERDQAMARAGVAVLRVTNAEVFEHLPAVVDRIRAALRARRPETVYVDT